MRFKEMAGDRICLLISHRFTTVSIADRIVVLSDGRIVEEGSHSELMDRAGVYARMYRMQAEQYWKEQADRHASGQAGKHVDRSADKHANGPAGKYAIGRPTSTPMVRPVRIPVHTWVSVPRRADQGEADALAGDGGLLPPPGCTKSAPLMCFLYMPCLSQPHGRRTPRCWPCSGSSLTPCWRVTGGKPRYSPGDTLASFLRGPRFRPGYSTPGPSSG